MEQNEHSQIMLMLGEMRSDIKTIKEQTIKTNGRVSAHDERLSSLESINDQEKGGMRIITLIAGAGLAVASAVVTVIVEKLMN